MRDSVGKHEAMVGGHPDDGDAVAAALTRLGPVARTMLISLAARAAESRDPNGLRPDPTAEELVERIDVDFAAFNAAWKTRIGVALRGLEIDRMVARFHRRFPGGSIVLLGAGLDGRPHMKSLAGGPQWVATDLPESLAFRESLLGPADDAASVIRVPIDLTEESVSVVRRIAAVAPPPHLFIAEGVLEFVAERHVHTLVSAIGSLLPGSHLVFDAIGRLMIRFPWLHDSLPGSGAGFAWGIPFRRDFAGPLPGWPHAMRCSAATPLITLQPDRWKWMRWLRHSRYMRHQFLLIRLDGPDADMLAESPNG